MKNLYNLVCEGIFRAASAEELVRRKRDYIKKVIDEILKKNGTQNKDGSWDIEDYLYISNLGLTRIPVKFRKVGGFLDCSGNKLTTLEGSPIKVGGFFDCSDNKLTTLKGAPKEVSGSFYCFDNDVKFTVEDVSRVCKVWGTINV